MPLPPDVLNFMQSIIDIRRKTTPPGCDLQWACLEEVVLKFGHSYEKQPRPKKYRKGTPKHCFYNSAVLAMRNPNLIYVEGYGFLRKHGIPIPHAWLAERGSTRVIDVTTDNVEHYHGVPFRTDYLKKLWEANPDGVSILDNWHDDFPILQMSEAEIRELMESYPD